MLRSITDFDERFDSANARMEGRLAASDTKYERKVEDLDRRISTVQARNEALEARVGTLEAEVRDLKAYVGDLEAELKGTNAEVKAFDTRAESLENTNRLHNLSLMIFVQELDASGGKVTLNVTRESFAELLERYNRLDLVDSLDSVPSSQPEEPAPANPDGYPRPIIINTPAPAENENEFSPTVDGELPSANLYESLPIVGSSTLSAVDTSRGRSITEKFGTLVKKLSNSALSRRDGN
ncbi:hypothetical protein QCA50_013855 [Cerrena zonata]|uniref:Uncharacterized protein n=1 Tax=Cerrena zonata TaxID=2478898 RepID=A0AAW0FSV4_9APHY